MVNRTTKELKKIVAERRAIDKAKIKARVADKKARSRGISQKTNVEMIRGKPVLITVSKSKAVRIKSNGDIFELRKNPRFIFDKRGKKIKVTDPYTQLDQQRDRALKRSSIIIVDNKITTTPSGRTLKGGRFQVKGGIPAVLKFIKQKDEQKKQQARISQQSFGPRRSLLDIVSEPDKPTKPQGTFTKERKLTLPEKITRERAKQIQKTELASGTGEKIFRGVAVAGVLGAAQGVVGVANIVMNPAKAGADLVRFANELRKNPRKVIVDEANRFIIDPVGVAVEYITFSKIMGAGVKGAKKSPVGRFIAEEMFIRKQPKKFQPAVRSIIKSSKVQEKINPFKIKDIKKVDLFEVKTLTKPEAVALKRTLQKTDSVVFGSLASRTLSKKRTPLPKDVDVAVRNINQFSKEFLNNLPARSRSLYKLKGEKIIRIRGGEALFDIKPLNRLIPQRGLITRKGSLPVAGYATKLVKGKGSILPKFKKKVVGGQLTVPTQKIVKIEGIKLVGFGEQTTRKGLGTLQTLIEKEVRRAKDPASFIASLELQVEVLKTKAPKTAIGKFARAKKIKTIKSAVTLLKSKSFTKLLEGRIGKAILKQYPLLKKLDKAKLKKLTSSTKARFRRIIDQRKIRLRKTPQFKRLAPKRAIKVRPKKVSRLKASKLKKSRLAKSRLVKSRVPKSRLKKSRVPKSRTPRSRTPSKTPSKTPSRAPSRLKASKLKSRVPSRVPSKVPSKTPSRVPSRLTASKLRAFVSKAPPAFKKKLKKVDKRVKTVFKSIKAQIPQSYRPNLEAIVLELTIKKPLGKITGLEVRGIILKKATIKRRKALSKRKR